MLSAFLYTNISKIAILLKTNTVYYNISSFDAYLRSINLIE